jgi:ABC-type nitrate/sulfonate/bicarbonate transport system permease component
MNQLQKFIQIRGKTSIAGSVLLGIIPIIVVIALWWYVTSGESPEDRIISPVTLPSPVEVVTQIPSLITKGHLFEGILASFTRVSLGFLCAVMVALPLGIFMGSFGKIKAMFQPLTMMSGYLPIAALVPLTLSWFGTGEEQKVMFLAIAFFVYLVPLVLRSMDKVDEVYIQTAYTLGAKRRHIVTKVLIPIAAYDIWQAMRLAFGVGWTYIILAEIIFSDAGLGQIIIIAQRRGPREYMYLVIIVIALLAWLTDRIFSLIGRILFPYKVEQS